MSKQSNAPSFHKKPQFSRLRRNPNQKAALSAQENGSLFFSSSGGSFQLVPDFARCCSPQRRPGKRNRTKQPGMVFRRRSAARSVGIEKRETLSWELADYCTSVRA